MTGTLRRSVLLGTVATLLLDQFTGSTVGLSLSKISSSWAGACIRCSSSTGTSAADIGFVGSAIDPTAADAAISANTNFVDIVYDQSGNGNHATVEANSRRWKLIKISTGVYGLQQSSGTGMVIADAASHKTTIVDLYYTGQIGETFNDSTNYNTVLCAYGPTTSASLQTAARWGFILSEGGNGDGLELPRNGSTLGSRTSQDPQPTTIPIGNGFRTNFHTWNYNSNRLSVRRNDVLVWDDVTFVSNNGNSGTTPANVTYTGTCKIYIGNNGTYAQGTRGIFQSLIIFGTTRADHASINASLMTSWGTAEPPTSWDSGDGFLWTPQYLTDYILDSADDINGIRWWHEHGAYPPSASRGPSVAIASNVNNGISLVRYEVRPQDNDTIDNGNERAERAGHLGATTAIVPGDSFERYLQFMIEDGNPQLADWALFLQTHINNDIDPDTPDLFFMSAQGSPGAKGDFLQFITSRANADTNRGSPIAYTRNTWYGIRISATWSSAHTADLCQVWFGLATGTLTQIVNVSGSIFPIDSGAYIKQGIYRGAPGDNDGKLAIRFANEKFSKTLGAYSAYVTSQPALPTHA